MLVGLVDARGVGVARGAVAVAALLGGEVQEQGDARGLIVRLGRKG